MRLVVCGKNDAAVEALEFAVARGDEVWAIATAGDAGEDGWQRSLRGAARRLGVPCDQPGRINDPAFVHRLQAFHADALVSIQYDQILRGPLLGRVGCPCLNLHFALLPLHRGVAPIAWAILAGDAEAGVTLHHMVEDIDAGDVVARRAVPIAPDTTARELYDAVSRAAGALFRASHPFPPALLATRLPQDPGLASYHRADDIDFTARRVDWSRPAETVQRWIRAFVFPPMQHPESAVDGRRLAITRVAGGLGEPVAGTAPGTVVRRAPDGIDVAAADRTVRILALSDPANPRATAADVLGSVAVGARLA
jgi:methionyl-tRNA formyltransferase